MRPSGLFALLLLTATILLENASAGALEKAEVRKTENYVKTFKAMLGEDMYYIVAQPEVNDTVERVFESAAGAAYRFKTFFSTPKNYPGIDKHRSSILSYTADFLNSTRTALNNLCMPFGSENCELLPDNLHPERIFTMDKLVQNLTKETVRIHDELDSSTFVANASQVIRVSRHCNAFDFHTPLERHIASGCINEASENPSK